MKDEEGKNTFSLPFSLSVFILIFSSSTFLFHPSSFILHTFLRSVVWLNMR